jgi:hypothetical protein
MRLSQGYNTTRYATKQQLEYWSIGVLEYWGAGVSESNTHRFEADESPNPKAAILFCNS